MINIEEKEITQNWDKEKYDMPEVTIWCTAFNHEKYIAQCLDGFLMQKTTFPFEIVVHDDASRDHTADVIYKYAEKFPNIVKAVVEEKNVFSMGEILFGRMMVDNVRAKYVALCEGDDYWSNTGKLQMQYEFMEKNGKYSVVGHLTKSIDQNDNSVATFINSVPGEYDIKANEKWQLFAHVSSYFYRNVFMDMSIEERDKYFGVPVPGDRKLPILLMKYGKLYVLPEEMSVYRYMSCPTSFTSQQENRSLFNGYMEFENLHVYAQSLGIEVDYTLKEKEQLLSAFYCLTKGNKQDFVKIILFRKQYLKDLLLCMGYAFGKIKKKLGSCV